ncbi:MAG TPA: glycosyl hydrolase family 28 protein [Terriglobales bacterium]|nr:glycosyl hydrolase family 28 protein [Terriglobales bacterium]
MQRVLPCRTIILCVLIVAALSAQCAAQCTTATGGGGFVNSPFTAQTGTFTATFDATSSLSHMNSVVALSHGAGTAYAAFANLVAFNGTMGVILARDGGGYSGPTPAIPYSGGNTYHFRLVVNVPVHTYDIFVTPPGGSELTVGTGFHFRTEQNTVTSLDNLGVFVGATSGTLTVCNFSTGIPQPNFAVSVSPTSQTTAAGTPTNYTVTVTPSNSFTGNVALSVSGLPASIGASFSPTPVTITSGPASSTLTVSPDASTAANTYSFTITGTSGSTSHSTGASVVVTQATVPSFSLAVSPASQSVTAGNSASYTVTATSHNNFNGSVGLSASGLLSGESAGFSPSAITVPANGSSTSTMTVTTSTSTSGSSTITVTGTSGTLSATASTLLTVNSSTGNVFNVRTACGAAGNGSTNDAGAINHCIALASAASGGGTVEFPAGTYASTSIHMMSNVTLQLDAGSTIRGTGAMDPAEPNPFSAFQDFGHSHFHAALIWGEHLSNIGFTGTGTIDGGGRLVTGNPGSGQGDKAISLRECNNVTVTGITIRNGGHFGILVNGIVGMTVDNVHILEANQRDGFNLINSQHVTVSNSDIQGSDDSMCLKSDFALGRDVLNTDIHIFNDHILSTGNNATQFGSETCGSYSNIHFDHLTITAAGKAGIGITSNDGAVIDGITYDTITMSGTTVPIWIKTGDRARCGGPRPPVGIIRNISISNVTAVHSRSGRGEFTNTMSGRAGVPIQNVTIDNVNLTEPGGHPASDVNINPPETNDWQPAGQGTKPSYGWWLRHVSGITFHNSQVHFDANDGRPAFIVVDGQNVTLDGVTFDRGSASPYDLGFNGVNGFHVVNTQSSTGQAPRINAVNSTPF